jgi:hypothetical protein
MGESRRRSMVGALLFLLVGAACGGARTDQGGGVETSPQDKRESPIVSAKDFSRSRFDEASIDVNNRWFPLRPGTRHVFRGRALDEGEPVERQVISTVTDLVKEIAGVRAVVVWERDYDDGELVEAELAFFAEDTQGNVWHLGEYPEEYENGKLDKAPAWIEGQRGARAGLAMKAKPRLGERDYAQGWAPAPLFWDDRARVYAVGERTCVPVDCYDDVLVMEEFEKRKPGAFQLKFYAPDVGNVRVGWRGPKEKEREVLELVERVQLNGAALAKARRQALALEERAYRISNVYQETPPAETR